MNHAKPTQAQFLIVRMLLGAKEGKKIKTQKDIAKLIPTNGSKSFTQTDVTNAETGKTSGWFLKEYYENQGFRFGIDGITVIQAMNSEKEKELEKEIAKYKTMNQAKEKEISNLKRKLGIPDKKFGISIPKSKEKSRLPLK